MTAAVQVYDGEGAKLGARPRKPRFPKEEHLPPGQMQSCGVYCHMKTGECSYSYDTIGRHYFISRRQAVRVLGEDEVARRELSVITAMRQQLDKDSIRDKELWPNHPTSKELWAWTIEEMVLANKVDDTRNQWNREGRHGL